jgi:hypothetical protein
MFGCRRNNPVSLAGIVCVYLNLIRNKIFLKASKHISLIYVKKTNKLIDIHRRIGNYFDTPLPKGKGDSKESFESLRYTL